MKSKLALLLIVCMLLFSGRIEAKKWKSLFNGKDLTGWTVHGKANWSVRMVFWLVKVAWAIFILMQPVPILKQKGCFVFLIEKGNSGFYFRCNPPADNPDGFPNGYEAQICNSQDAYTGWLWKPGKPTGKATELLTKDGEWFEYHIKMVGEHIQFWINEKLVMTYDDKEYKSGHFAIQGHNPGMKIEAKELYYREVKK